MDRLFRHPQIPSDSPNRPSALNKANSLLLKLKRVSRPNNFRHSMSSKADYT
jgi:hypothetical protein